MTNLTQEQKDHAARLRKGAEAYGMDGLRMLVLTGFTKEQLEAAYQKDFYLNESTCGSDFALVLWDNLAAHMRGMRMQEAAKAAGLNQSLATRVSMLKHVARTIATNNEFYDLDGSNSINEYLEDMRRGDFLNQTVSHYYEDYKEFCHDNDYHPRTNSAFRKQVCEQFNLLAAPNGGCVLFMEPQEAEARKAEQLARRGAK